MASFATEALRKVSLVGQHRTAVVVGGTLGIGAAIARHLAKLGCSRIVIFGRNEARGEAVLEDLHRISSKADGFVAEFVKGELSDSQSMRTAADNLQKAGGIDYLVMCQKGLPTGTINENADGYDTPFAVQAISRFTLAYLLTKRGALASGASVISIAAQGQTLDDLSVDDLSLKGRLSTGSQTTMFLNQSKRDSCVLDAFHEELNIRYPQYRYFHLSPGLVSSEQFDVNKFPGIMKYAVWFGQRLIGTTPDKYALLPVYLLTAAPASSERYFDSKLKPKRIGKWAADPENREKLWKKLVSIIGENEGQVSAPVEVWAQSEGGVTAG
ncbi:hypothetical protein MSAN_01341300 [Mycena sanguinolenta]|uniref:NAD(P)-binding protein n=1 Tax=Mycena sanguinolenta TaxID=230812 RepID=A0A8H6YE29_9AGAR|nr:hypothetical protein MSAN_01341300 [Mycena sanguinolenta]